MATELFDLMGKGGHRNRDQPRAGTIHGARVGRAGRTSSQPAGSQPICENSKPKSNPWAARALALPLDVRDEKSIHQMADAAAAHYGRIDILVTNAGCNIRQTCSGRDMGRLEHNT